MGRGRLGGAQRGPRAVGARPLRELAAGPPLALSFAKQLVDAAWNNVVRTGIRQELAAQVALLGSDDHQEARAAIAEQRAPKYSGS